jgi:hypothetical protein
MKFWILQVPCILKTGPIMRPVQLFTWESRLDIAICSSVKWWECIPEFMFLVTQALLDISGKWTFDIMRGQQVWRLWRLKISTGQETRWSWEDVCSIFMEVLSVWDVMNHTFCMYKQCILGPRKFLSMPQSLLAFNVTLPCCLFSNMWGPMMMEDDTPHLLWQNGGDTCGDLCMSEGFPWHQEEKVYLFTYPKRRQWASSDIIFIL